MSYMQINNLGVGVGVGGGGGASRDLRFLMCVSFETTYRLQKPFSGKFHFVR